MEDFGSGPGFGSPLPPGTTTFNYVAGTPFDGDYTISSMTNFFDWHDTVDNTPNDTNGRAFIVNAAFDPGEFFRTDINGLCENTSYEFSAFVLNLLPDTGGGGNGIPINVRFQIWDDTDTNLLAQGDTGPVNGTPNPEWIQYALLFTTQPGQNGVILRMLNNGAGGIGNDLAIDDIMFRTCGDLVTITGENDEFELIACNDELSSATVELTANPVFSKHFYQWQESIDQVIWTDISGEINQNFFAPTAIGTRFYRSLIAEDSINVQNNQCNTISDIFEITIDERPDPPISLGDILNCEEDVESLTVEVPQGVTVDWYDAPTGGNLLLSDNIIFETDIVGIYYAEAVSLNANCTSISRTEVSLSRFDPIEVDDETVFFCEDQNIELIVDVDDDIISYNWSTGEVTPTIIVNEAGIVTVDLVNNNGCTATQTFTVNQINRPRIQSVTSDFTDIIIETQEEGDFEYSIDGINFQLENILRGIPGGFYDIIVRDRNGCGVDTINFLHYIIPRFFTPNGDGDNDTFTLIGIETFESSEVNIFNRFGKLLVSSQNTTFSWDGTFQNKQLPASDYWYFIRIDDQEIRGHFTLKR